MIIGQRLIEREDGVAESFTDADGILNVVTDVFEVEDALVGVPDEAQAMDLFRADPICDMCRAAKLAEDGVMACTVPTEQLHSQCRSPGGCQCDCQYAQGGVCVKCGRSGVAGTMRSGLRGAECVNTYRCAQAMLDSRAASVVASDSPHKPTGRQSTGRPCACNCGGMTKGGEYLPGHRIKHLGVPK